MSTHKPPPHDYLNPMPYSAQSPRPQRRFQIRWHESREWVQVVADSVEAAVIDFAKRHKEQFASRALIYVREVVATEPIRYAIYNTQDGKTKANGPNGILFSK